MKKKSRKIIRNSIYTTLLYLGSHQDDPLLYQTTLASRIKKSVTTVNYHITKMRREGLIENNSLHLTPKGKKKFLALWNDASSDMDLRSHNIQVKFNVVRCPQNYPEFLSDRIWTPFGNRRYKGRKKMFEDIVVLFYSPKKLVCVLPDIYGNSTEEIASTVLLLCIKIKERLEGEIDGLILGDYELARITTLHVALQKEILAHSFVEKLGNYKSAKIEVDTSKGTPEIESIDSKTALYDADTIQSELKKITSLLNEKEKSARLKQDKTDTNENTSPNKEEKSEESV